jgi:hypothetical protein
MSVKGVKIFPRRKAIGCYFGSDSVQTQRMHRYIVKPSSREAICIDIAMMRPYFGLPQRLAAAHLGISLTTLKGVCRKLGITKWGVAPKTEHASAEDDGQNADVDCCASSRASSPAYLSSASVTTAEPEATTLSPTDLKPAGKENKKCDNVFDFSQNELHEAFNFMFDNSLALPCDDVLDRNVHLRQPKSQSCVDDEAYHLHDFTVVDDTQLQPFSNLSGRRALCNDLNVLCEGTQSSRYVAEDDQVSRGDDLAYLVSFSSVYWDRKGPEETIKSVLPHRHS